MVKYLFLFLFICNVIYGNSEENKFVLLLGPSGVGKSTIIHHLKEIDSRFVYVTPYTTRELRPGEKDKIHASLDIIKQLEAEGKLLTVNEIYGIYNATPKDLIDTALKEGKYPILDWPANKMDIMLVNYPNNLFTIYIAPESLEILQERLSIDGRDKNGSRYSSGKEELERYYHGEFDKFIDLKTLNYQIATGN